ncbi:MAG: S8 family serine peptidase, partial [Acidobacteriota bacterium]
SGSGTTENIADGIRWAADHGARVISMSLNFRCGESIPPIEDALEYAHSQGVTLVGSTGNRSAQSCPSLPATAPQVIGVGGSNESGCVAGYSFISPAVDLVAPGGGASHVNRDCPYTSRDRPILQVSMIGRDPARFGISSGWRGTSMAAAHVAGASAAVLASDAIGPKKGPAQVKQRLFGTARLPDFASGQDPSGFGAGIINLGRATNPDVAVP